MVYRGHVRNGRVEIDEDARLPEGAEVDVTVRVGAEEPHDDGPTLYERLQPVIGKAQGLPPDAARNVDHYLYGHPKK